uniref:Protein UPS1, mitochondrial n=1 Tax=Talaromyces marneffei PM1 TaxID=1077442 RepID=A0A093VIN5_TALMA
MKFFELSSTYDYSFSAVSLAYFLRYPNPYSKHVLTSDLLPKGIGGSENSGQSYILETTVVDAKEGWMKTESRNMEWTGILSVVEKQHYEREMPPEGEKVNVRTTVTFVSRLGQSKLLGRSRKAAEDSSEVEEEAPKRGIFSSLSTAGIQRTIELIGVTRTRDAILRSKQGMNVVLERLRHGGIVAVSKECAEIVKAFLLLWQPEAPCAQTVPPCGAKPGLGGPTRPTARHTSKMTMSEQKALSSSPKQGFLETAREPHQRNISPPYFYVIALLFFG